MIRRRRSLSSQLTRTLVVAIGECSFTNRHTGKTVTTPKVDVSQFLHGKIVEVSEFYDTAQTIAAARP